MNIECPECKNEIFLNADTVKKGYYFECRRCGTTMKIENIDEEGKPQVAVIEEEK